MALIIDDLAVVAAETAEAVEAVEAVEAINPINAISEADINVGAKDFPIRESSDISNTDIIDEMPLSDGIESAKDLSNDMNVFYDEFPDDVTAQGATETTDSPIKTEVEQVPESYEEFCETRNSGGSYKEVRDEGWGWNDEPPHEVHHMPADSASDLERKDGPAIAMDYNDHQQTASCGSSREAKEYRAQQQELIKEGKFREALQMDIDDIHDKFRDKYNDAISQMLDYVEKLEEEGKI